MHYQGQELISRSTEVSNRSLVTLAFAKIMVVFLSIEMSSFNIFDVPISYNDFNRATNWVLCLLLINHILSWIGDYRSFQGWNSNRKMTGSARFSSGGSQLRSELEDALEATDNLRTQTESFNDQSIRDRIKLLEKYEKRLECMVAGAESLSFHAKLYLFGWFLIVPVSLGLTAIFAEYLYRLLMC